MPRKKKFTPKPKEAAVDSDEWPEGFSNDDDTDDETAKFGRNEVDKFHKQKEKELLKNSALNRVGDDDDSSEEEGIMGFSGDDDSEDEDDDDEKPQEDGDYDDEDDDDELGQNYYQIRAKKEEMASDLESNDENEEGYLPDSKSWGQKKSLYYNTDYVDQGDKRRKVTDEDLAKAEEEEALAIQKRLLEEMNGVDLDFDWMIGDQTEEAEKDDKESGDDEGEERVAVDLSKLSKKDKLSLLKKDSPEMLPLIDDFKQYMTEARDKLEPIINLAKNPSYSRIAKAHGFNLLEIKYHLILRYATNISFYMVLKSKRIPVKNHPVIKQLFSFKRLITEIEKLQSESQVNKDMEFILDKLARHEEFELIAAEEGPSKKKKRRAEVDPGLISATNKKARVAGPAFDKQQTSSGVAVSEEISDDEQDELDDGEERAEEEDAELERRGITYQIAKNKGLTAQKKKELRNPRVKHRMKFKRAQVRRKGQVRAPRTEVKKYGGELSGIKSGLVRSIKFKH